MADDAEVVGDEDVGQSELVLQLVEQVDDLRLDRDVERGDRLVEQDQLRIDGQRPRDADPLALAAGELVREAAEVLGMQADPLEQLTALGSIPSLCTPRSRSGVARIWPTRLRGFSDACGSWKTICISRRIGSRSFRPLW